MNDTMWGINGVLLRRKDEVFGEKPVFAINPT
jgi:hypothetical protein